MQNPLPATLSSAMAVDRLTLWVTESGGILKTTNSGAAWEAQSSSMTSSLSSIAAPKINTAESMM
ncbi:MAG: hypothetical protein HY308_04140 [Gammaproteobacteria bacterium]|nr:hypothetical protein [Gammaproteobacteria bacterium]